MLKCMRSSVWIFVLLMVFSISLSAQNFLYTNNDLVSANSVSAYSVDTNGALSPVPGSPFATNGAGTGGNLYSSNRIIVVKGFLYASNSGSNTVSAFAIDPSTGVLTLVSGSPFPTGAFNDSTVSGISLAATPDGKYFYVGSTGFDLNFNFGPITIFSINASGALTPTGSSVSVGGPIYSMKVSPDGKFLAVALNQTARIAVFAIQSDGSLQPVTNSPFALASGSATGVDINCASNLLYAGGPSGNVYAFNIASDGQLTAVTNSPFDTGHASNQVVALSTDDKTLFASNQGDDTVTAFEVGSSGGLTVPGISVNAAGIDGTNTLPGGLAVSEDGTLLFVADKVGEVSSFVLGGSSPLIFGAINSTVAGSQLQSVAAYPAKACSPGPSSSLAASLQIFAGPPPGADLEATLSLVPSLVVDPLTQAVEFQIGSFSLSLPAGSFKWYQNGKNSGMYVFQGTVASTNLKVQIAPLGQNQFAISAVGKQVDLSGLSSPITVTVGIGGNSASTSVVPISAPLGLNPHGN
ncbi:MAG TPA: beta-propeller fold lactonase family protein [Terriglobia bacterium]|nr:beta-propeller fold lactonase family protein [Terriglobia bacterium]